MFIVRTATVSDVPAIAAIYNEAIRDTVATFDTEEKSAAQMDEWFRRHDERFRVFVGDLDGIVIGWSSLTRWSDRKAYDCTAETSFYVRKEYQNKGFGLKLLEAIVASARGNDFHTLLARIAAGSDSSIYLHKKFGFQSVGVMREVGRKFGRLVDVNLMQCVFETNEKI